MNKSIVPHQRTQYFYLPLEDDYIIAYETLAAQLDPIKEQEKRKLSGPSDCKAMIAATLERWMNNKRSTAKEEDDFYIYLTIDEWELYLRYRYRRSTIIHCLQEMEVEGTFVDHEGIHGEKGKVYRGTIKKCHYIQNTFAYQLNLPVLLFLLAQLPEQSPFQPKPRPSLGRPKNRLKINGINSDGISDEQNQEYPPRKNRIKLNRLILTDEQSKNKRYYGDEAASGQGLQDTIESTKITSNYIDSSLEDITTREGEDSLRRYDEGYAEEKRTSTFNDTSSQHIHNSPTPVDNSEPDASSAIMETGAPDALTVVTQQPAHPMESMRASNGSTDTSSLPIAIGPTSNPFSLALLELDILCEDGPPPCSNGYPVQQAMATSDFSYPMTTGNTPSPMQHNGSSASSTPTPVGIVIPSQPASLLQDAGSGIFSDAAVTTSNTTEQRDGVQESATSEVIQESFTELSTTKTEKKGKSKKIPPPAEKSTPTPEEKAREEAFQARCRGIYTQIVEWRGYALEDKGPLINERKYVRKLAEKYTNEQIASIRHHLFTKDFKWSKPSWRFKIGAYEIYYEAEPTLQLFKEEEKAKSNGHKGTKVRPGPAYMPSREELMKEPV